MATPNSPRQAIESPKLTQPPSRGHRFLHRQLAVLLACLSPLGLTAYADEEQDQIAVLQSSASSPQKSAACQRLRVIGTAKSVPALAALLVDEQNSPFARHALEGLPFPEAGAALRAALPTAKAQTQAGLVTSLGWRGEAEAVPLLVPLLSSPNTDLAAATASALGRIGGPVALAGLNGVTQQAPPQLRSAAQEGLLRCADRLRGGGGDETAMAIYRQVFFSPASDSIRVAAWRGFVLTDDKLKPNRDIELVRQALAGSDHRLQLAAMQLVRVLDNDALIAACLTDWPTLSAGPQLALLDARVKSKREVLPTVRLALNSPHAAVRVAALEAMADLTDPSVIPTLAQAAASRTGPEREAARDTLNRVRGPGMREALLAHLATAEPHARAELLRALGERSDRQAAEVLLRNAAADAAPARLAALESLQRLAMPETLAPLLELAQQCKSESQLEPLLKTLASVCQASPDRTQTESRVIDAIRKSPPAQRRLLLPLLAELGTADALAAAQAATRDTDLESARQAIRVLTQWPNAAPAAFLLEIAQTSPDATTHVLALRGGIEVSGQEPDAAKRLALLGRAMSTARRADEKRLVLAQLAQLASPEALETAVKELANPDLVNEAGLAAVTVAEKLAPTAPQVADDAAAKVLAQCKSPETVRRAWALRRTPVAAGGFIRDWLVCGPFRQTGVEGATAVFDLVLGPEKPGQKVDWKAVTSGDHLDLSGLFPDQANCVAYLRAQIISPDNLDGLLLLGSDDGLKAWLNGEVVHSHNVDRGMVIDQDRAPVKLKQGANTLLLKVTQGGGGWAACARIVATNGQAIPGLQAEPPKP